MKNLKNPLGLSVLILISYTLLFGSAGAESVLEKLSLPDGFHIQFYSENVPNARSMTLGDDGTVYVGTGREGKVYAVLDKNKDGKSEKVVTLLSGLNMPNGVAFRKGALYIAEISRIIRINNVAKHLNVPPKPEVVYDWYPTDVHHGWKYIRFGPDGKLYVPVGAPCNICKPKKEIYATITRMNPEGGDFEIFACGIRNTVGFDWHPTTKSLWFTENGRDRLGEEVPPEELNHAPKSGLEFGYPYCHAGEISDPEFGQQASCDEFVPPSWKFPAHVAPLGIRFYTGDQFPDEYRNQLFVAQHGSWNRKNPMGYRVVLVKFKGTKPVSDINFAEGWLQPSGKVLGRPVDILQMPDGALLVSDDQRGVIYRIFYRKSSSNSFKLLRSRLSILGQPPRLY